MSNKPKNLKDLEIVQDKYLDIINNIIEPKYKYSLRNVCLFTPWGDYGYGIKARELYLSLKHIGFNPFVFSFLPNNEKKIISNR